MHMFNERLQVLMTKGQRERLERIAAREGRSVGSVIRDAVDAYTLRRGRPPAEALESLFSLDAPVADWDLMKAEIALGSAGSEV